MPLIDRMVRAAGWNPYVMRQFVTLCERSGAAYSVDTFADHVLSQIVDGRLPKGWKGSSIPAAIAALVQVHADRLHPLPAPLARKLLQVLDALVDLGDRRSAALQQSESFRGVCLAEAVSIAPCEDGHRRAPYCDVGMPTYARCIGHWIIRCVHL